MEKDASRVFKSCRKYIVIFSLLGIGCSYYAIFVGDAKARDASYVALCDISEGVRCSNVLTSVYSKGFGIIGWIFGEASPMNQSNGFYGLWFYAGTMALSLYPAKFLVKTLLVMTILSLAMSAYLGYILLYVLKELCIVCITSYFFNFVLFVLSFRSYGAVNRLKSTAKVPDYSSYLDGKAAKKRV